MRKILFTLVILSVSLGIFADIPAGKNIYLDVSQCPAWQNAPSYLIHLSGTGMTHVMQPVTGKANLYVFTTIASTQYNVNFGLGKTAITQDYSGWFGGDVSKNVEWTGARAPQWSESTPVFQIECTDANNPTGHGVSLPMDGSVANATYTISDLKCVDSTYVINITVTMTGTANLQISGDLLNNPRQIPQCSGTYQTTVRAKWQANSNHSFTIAAYSDASYTSMTNSKTLKVVAPTLECEITAETIELCEEEAKNVTLTAKNTGDSIQWYDAAGNPLAHTQSVKVSPSVPGATYTAKIFEPYINPDNNMMVNGDFENGYSGFMSDYEPIKDKLTNQPVLNPTWIYSNKYKNGTNYGKYYCITNEAYDLQESGIFAHITAHGGEEFLVVDATNQGYAWYTNTAQSPQLVLTAGQTYLFSYWVACPNTGEQLQDPKAQLQFTIELHMPDGSTKTAPLTSTYTVGSETPVNDWYYQEERWYCPYNCNDVTIGVKDLTQSASGNDFCLDDIIFQPVNSASMRVSMTEHHPVVVKDCEIPCPDVKINLHDTTVCDTMMPIKWRGHQYDREMVYRDTIRTKNQLCDSIITVDSLVVKHCGDCEYFVYAKWDDVLFVDNGKGGLKGLVMTYSWYCDGKLIPDATGQYYYNPAGMKGHVYKAEVMLKDSSILTSCEFAFEAFERSADKNPGKDRKMVSEEVHQVLGRMTIIRRRYDDGTVETDKYWQMY